MQSKIVVINLKNFLQLTEELLGGIRFQGFFVLAFLILTGCKKEEESAPKPEAVLYTDFETYTLHEPIKLINNSQGAVRYRWELGNGLISEEENPMVTYTNLGDYTIKLTAYNTNNQSTTVSKKIRIGLRVLAAVSIDSLNFAINWAPQDGPDLRLIAKEGQRPDPMNYFLNLDENFTPAMVPVLYTTSIPLRVNATEYTFELVEVDAAAEQSILKTQVFPNSLDMKRDKDTGYYFHAAKNSNAKFTLFYAIR